MTEDEKMLSFINEGLMEYAEFTGEPTRLSRGPSRASIRISLFMTGPYTPLHPDLQQAIVQSAIAPKNELAIEREAMTRDIEQYAQDMWRGGEVLKNRQTCATIVHAVVSLLSRSTHGS